MAPTEPDEANVAVEGKEDVAMTQSEAEESAAVDPGE